MTDVIDETRFPQLASYVHQLPEGLSSYPDCQSKGTLVKTALEDHDVRGIADGLPEVLRQMLLQPPIAGVWVPAAVCDAVFCAVVDTFYPTEEAAIAWTYERTMRTGRSRMYRAITRAAGPSRLLRLTAATHRLFQRGTELDAEPFEGGARVRLSHPPHLHCHINQLVNVAMLQAMLELAGALDVEVKMTESSPIEAIYVATWA